jgi:energy-coupling factor transport system substrate-specific component
VSRFLSGATLALAAAFGLVAIIYPFLVPPLQTPGGVGMARAGEAPLVFVALSVLSLVVVAVELGTGRMTSQMVAVLGILAAVNAVLRFAETTFLPVFGGFSPIFLLLILAAYVYGATFGFLLGVLSLLVSALFTGGFGPWLPYQMQAAGWMGITAAWMGLLPLKGSGSGKLELVALAILGFTWGFLYGIVMNLFFWPYAAGQEMFWSPGMEVGETLARFGIFYGVTSLVWDAVRAVGNAALILVLGAPLLRVLRRFERRFRFRRVTQPITG